MSYFQLRVRKQGGGGGKGKMWATEVKREPKEIDIGKKELEKEEGKKAKG